MEKFSHDLPEATLTAFDRFAENEGYVRWRVIDAALRLFMSLTSEQRSYVMRSSTKTYVDWLSKIGIPESERGRLAAAELEAVVQHDEQEPEGKKPKRR